MAEVLVDREIECAEFIAAAGTHVGTLLARLRAAEAVCEAAVEAFDSSYFRQWEPCEACGGIGSDDNLPFRCHACLGEGGSWGSVCEDAELFVAALDTWRAVKVIHRKDTND